jgi:hypothetical protein
MSFAEPSAMPRGWLEYARPIVGYSEKHRRVCERTGGACEVSGVLGNVPAEYEKVNVSSN